MLFISISPKCSARITIPWTALIYVSAPHPVPNLTGSCRDTLIEWELKTDLWGRQCVSACLFIHLTFLFFSSKSSKLKLFCCCFFSRREFNLQDYVTDRVPQDSIDQRLPVRSVRISQVRIFFHGKLHLVGILQSVLHYKSFQPGLAQHPPSPFFANVHNNNELNFQITQK